MSLSRCPFDVILAVGDVGGRLGISGDKLRMLLPPDCPPELKASIRQHKAALLELLSMNFLLVRSDALKATVIWVPDAATKGRLAALGGDPGTIYTADELETLVNRRVTVGDMPAIHAAKQRFDGRVIEP